MMDAYNQVVLEICKTENVPCIDIASKLPKDTRVFYDDIHFNISGCAMVADLVVAGLMNHYEKHPEIFESRMPINR